MADELQSLIERIQREGIEKAEADAAAIVTRAKAKAAEIVKTAETQAQALLKQADADAQVYTKRSTITLTQAARDVLIAVGQGLESILDEVIRKQVGQALSPETLKAMLGRIAQAYAAHGMTENRLTVLLSPDDQKSLARLVEAGVRDALGQGVDLRADDRIVKGFRISIQDGHVVHDFTEGTIAEAIGALLKPHLAEIVHRAAQGMATGATKA
ncbi:MAG: ATPase [Verrucomicrobia bacterium]|nr:ATPase [Verrucomicrobiota bacterium]MBU1734968.1 ATPase [Verrucomicrobiota bacterium]MBU1857929.1 ATPase [Verrucomicrobiota bacterium]